MRQEIDQRTGAYSNYGRLAAAETRVTEAARIKDLPESQFVVHTNPEDIFGYEPSQKPDGADKILYAPKDVQKFKKIVDQERERVWIREGSGFMFFLRLSMNF